MQSDNNRAMMYWSSLLQKQPSEELEEKINQKVLNQQSSQMKDNEPENPLRQDIPKNNEKVEHLPPKADTKQKDLDNALKTSKLLKDVFSISRKQQINAHDFSSWKHSKVRLIHHMQDIGEEKGTQINSIGGTEPSIGYEMASHEVEAVMNNLETKMIENMDLTTLLIDDDLASTITPQMGMVETLLIQKGKLSGKALINAKKLIRRYVKKLAEEFKPKVEKSVIKVRDPDVSPNRTFRNLDIKRTIWDNLPNWNADEKKLYVSNLRFHRASQKQLPSKLIIVVDQSGSMIPAMVQSTILASIFAGLPNVEVNLFAFDTKVVNLTRYVRDPFEVLLQTRLGGGTHIDNACNEGKKYITDPYRTGFILITDYYERASYDILFQSIKDIQNRGASFVSVGPMSNRGRNMSINGSFVKRLQTIGIETIMGGIDNLIERISDVIS